MSTPQQYNSQAPPEVPPVNQFAARQVNGEAMTRLGIQRKGIERAADIAGTTPFTVWNFNPVPIVQWKLGQKYEIPPALGGLGKKRTVHWDGGERVASVATFRQYKGFSRPISINNEQGGDPNKPIEERTWKLMQPIELTRAFEYEYNLMEGKMGGVLVYQGDSHVVGDSSDQIIQVPIATRVEGNLLVYSTESVSLLEKLNQVLTKQKEYCFAKLQLAQDWYDREEARSSVADGPMGFAAWGRFAVEMGWQDSGEFPWMVKQKSLGGCKACGTLRSSGKALFCAKCNNPYDPFEAFMAGYDVNTSLLATLPEEQRTIVLNEKKRRARFFEETDEAPEKPKTHGKNKE
jgi:hypothetical protein